jgi:hypothetical protein
MLENPNRIGKQIFSRIRMVLALRDWIHGRNLLEIEKEFRIYSGTIQSAGDTIGWLAEGAFCLMGAMGLCRRRRVGLKKLSFEVKNGLPVAVRKLHARAKGHLSRKDMLLLCEQGITSVDHLLSSDRDFLAGLIGNSKVEIIMRELMEKPAADQSAMLGARSDDSTGKISLRLTGTMTRDRFRVMFRERPFLLTAKSFKYLFKLAAQRRLDGDGWIDKEQLEPGFNQARYLYNLKKELGNSVVNGQDLIENDRRGGYRLSLAADEIAFDLSSLSSLDDFEIAELSRRLTSA